MLGQSAEIVEVFAIDQTTGLLTKVTEELGPVGGSIIVALSL